MNKNWDISTGTLKHVLLTLAAGIPLFVGLLFYNRVFLKHIDKEVSLLVTIYFLAGIYAGRYFSQLWVTKHRSIPPTLLRLLLVIIVASTISIFLAAQFSAAINQPFLEILMIGLPLLVLSVSLGMLIKLVRATIKSQLEETKATKATAEQSLSELKLLQTQLSPHFLFNTLNNMYGLSLTQHEKIPQLLLKLSALLRYSVYDVKELYVPLKSEIEYINNYIDFEKIRIGDKLKLNITMEGYDDPNIKIAPLLLIVFIENAFKHAKNTTDQQVFIEITLKIWANSILFSVKNSNTKLSAENSILNKNSGFGLDNVTKRLELLYKNEYDLKIDDRDGFYTVMLQLKVK